MKSLKKQLDSKCKYKYVLEEMRKKIDKQWNFDFLKWF